MVQQTLCLKETIFGGKVMPKSGVKARTPRSPSTRSPSLRKRTVAAKVINKEATEQLEKQVEKRKADNMAKAADKLSPPTEKLRYGPLQSKPEAGATPEPEPAKPKPKVEIVRDYNEEEVNSQQPDKPSTPPPDTTGHFKAVIAVTPTVKVNSSPEEETDNQ